MSNTLDFETNDLQILEKAISSGIINVINTTSGFELNSSQIINDNNSLQESQLTGIMFLTGNINALLSIAMSIKTASTIVSYMTGIETAELAKEDIHDGVSELINMVAGSAKSLLKNTKFYFNLTSPFTIIGDNHLIVHKGKGNKLYKRFYFGEMEINIMHLIL